MDTNVAFYTISEVRRLVFGDKISVASLLSLIHSNKIPAERITPRRYLIPAFWVREKLDAALKNPRLKEEHTNER